MAGGSAGGMAGGSAGGMAGGSTVGLPDGGGVPDGGLDCATAPLDPILGTLVIASGANVVGSVPMPASIAVLGIHRGVLYGVDTMGSLRRLGVFPTLTLGPPIVTVVRPMDGGTVYQGGYLVSNGVSLLTGYTTFPDVGAEVVVVQPEDGGAQFINAPGNYTAIGLLDGGAFVVNGKGLGSATGDGLFGLRGLQSAVLASFPDSFSGSGFTALTASNVLVVGNFRPDFTNVVRAVAPALYNAPLTNGTSFVYTMATAPLVAQGDNLRDLTAAGDAAYVLRGAFGAKATAIERIPVTLSGATVTVGVPTDFVTNPGACTDITSIVSDRTNLYLVASDRLGRRLVVTSP
jgi:hypothetical protein